MAVIADAIKVAGVATMTAAAGGVFQSANGGNLLLKAPGSNRLAGKSFTVVANGYAFTGTGTYTATVQPIIYGDSSLATVTTKPLFSATAGTVTYTGTAGTAIPFSLFLELEGDSTSATAVGIGQSNVGGTLKAQAATVSPVSAINFASEPPIQFALGITVGGTLGAAPKFVLTDLHLEIE
jgi:hypothetical protein